MIDIRQLKAFRRKANLTQHQLAMQAGVSQSLIAKIESGRLDPSYSNVLKLEQALTSTTLKKEVTAEKIMTKKIIKASPQTKATVVAQMLTKHSISQIPVIQEGKSVGLIAESDIIKTENIATKKANEIMQEPAPVVSADTRISVLTSLLMQYPIILVTKKGILSGVITKADLIKELTR